MPVVFNLPIFLPGFQGRILKSLLAVLIPQIVVKQIVLPSPLSTRTRGVNRTSRNRSGELLFNMVDRADSTQSTTGRNTSIRIILLIPRRIGESSPVPREFMVHVDGVKDHGVFDRLSWPASPAG